MRKINSVLLLFFIIIIVLTQLFAEVFFIRANKFENNYRWGKALENYEIAAKLNPLKSSYASALGNLMMKYFLYKKDEEKWYEALNSYEKACSLNPRYAWNWYDLGKCYFLYFTSSKMKNDKTGIKKMMMKSYKKALSLDPYNYRLNYFVAYDLVSIWKDTRFEMREIALRCLKKAIVMKPGNEKNIYDLLYFYTHNFSILKQVTPDTYYSNKSLLRYLENNEIWQYRKEQAKIVEHYFKKEFPHKYSSKAREEKEFISDFISNNYENSYAGWVAFFAGKNKPINTGEAYWSGRLCRMINIPEGKDSISISMKGTSCSGVWPYIIVRLNDKEIGECFVNSRKWKNYVFDISGEKGRQVLSVTFCNDKTDPGKNEDRNLFLGDIKLF